MNSFNGIGRIGKEPERKYTSTQTLMVSFPICIDRWANGSKVSDWFDCVAFSKTAETISKYCKKGDMIGITGQFQTRTVEREDGSKSKFYSIVVNELSFINTGKKEEAPTETPTEVSAEAPKQNEEVGGVLPFEI